MAQAVARACWRRCFAFSLALRLFARIVLLDFGGRLHLGAPIWVDRSVHLAGILMAATRLRYRNPVILAPAAD